MANRVINTILNLRDNMSGGLIRAARNTQGVSREMQKRHPAAWWRSK